MSSKIGHSENTHSHRYKDMLLNHCGVSKFPNSRLVSVHSDVLRFNGTEAELERDLHDLDDHLESTGQR